MERERACCSSTFHVGRFLRCPRPVGEGSRGGDGIGRGEGGEGMASKGWMKLSRPAKDYAVAEDELESFTTVLERFIPLNLAQL